MDDKDARIEELEEEIEYLRRKNTELRKKLEAQRQEMEEIKIMKKSSGGRTKKDKKWQERFHQVSECIEAGLKAQETMSRLGMSKMTYYRYRKEYFATLQGKGEKSVEQKPQNSISDNASDAIRP